jgi:hypothetical protein
MKRILSSKTNMRIFFFFLLTLSLSVAKSQSIIEDSVFFKHANAYRTYKVWLPNDYDSTKNYHSIYCLDASLLFNLLTANVELYSDPFVAKMPPTIVVGLYFDHRNEDMDIDWNKGELGQQGIAFMDLVKNELVPKVEANYTTTSYRSIMGHSNSSSFIEFFMWNEPELFQGFLGMSQFQLAGDGERFCQLNPTTKKPVDYVFVSAKEDAEYRLESGYAHEQILDSCQLTNFNFEHIVLDKADHLTMVATGIPLGLEELYKSYRFELFPDSLLTLMLKEQPNPTQLMDSLIDLRVGKYDVEADFSFDDLNQYYNLFVLLKDSIGISAATQKYEAMFQDSSEFFYEAQHLEMMGAYHAAEKSYLRHLDYYCCPGYWSYMRLIMLYEYYLKDVREAMNYCLMGYNEIGDAEFLNRMKKLILKAEKDQRKGLSLLENHLSKSDNKSDAELICIKLIEIYEELGNDKKTKQFQRKLEEDFKD